MDFALLFLRDYFRVLLPLLVLLVGYRLVAVPFIEPPHAVPTPIGPTLVSDDQTPWWHDYFKEGAWQRNKPKILETPQGILLFEKWERLAPDRWRLYPLTLLIPQHDREREAAGENRSPEGVPRAIFIENPEGAEIQFREAIDWTSGKPPPVVAGQMNGQIKIFSPPRGDGRQQDGLIIDAADLRIDRRHIWTTQGVAMQIGRSQIFGRDLSIYLDQDLLSSSEGEADDIETPFSGLDHLDLIYVDRVHIELPDGGLFADRGKDVSHIERPRPAHAELQCDGAFQFDFHQSMASLSTNVELRHQLEGMPADVFQSDRLYLHFRWSSKSTPASQTAQRAPIELEDCVVDRIEAIGTQTGDPQDPSRWVQLEAPTIDARGRARWLRIELERGRMALANHLPGTVPNEPTPVYLQRENLQVWSPAIEYENPRFGGLKGREGNLLGEEENNLGILWAAGPGQASILAEDGDPWKLSWAKSLRMNPDGESDRLTIDGSANARSERQGRFAAETVDIWLKSLPKKLVDQVVMQTGGYEPSSVIPERLHATGQVFAHTDQLRMQVAEMQVWFQYPEIDAARLALQHSLSNPALPLSAASPTSNGPSVVVRQPGGTAEATRVASPLGTAFSSLAQIANNASHAGLDGESPSIARGPGQLAAVPTDLSPLTTTPERGPVVPMIPTNVTGEKLVAKLSQSSKGLVIEDMALTGIVTVTREQVSDTSPWPLTITGNELRMDSSDGGQIDATIVGTPAKLAIGSGAMESTEIRFNERRQMVWIDQPGHFRIPPEALQSIAARPAAALPAGDPGGLNAPGFILPTASKGDSVKWIEAPKIEWEGRMVFDGKVARMDGGVRLLSRMETAVDVLWHVDATAREMKVELEQPIDIAGRNKAPAKVAVVKLIDAVDIKAAQTDAEGNRRSLEHLEVPELTIYVPQQQWIGLGPGSLRSRRIGNANPASPKWIVSGQKSELPTEEVRHPQAELQCFHLRFSGRMEGEMNQQMITFHDRVETLLEPIFSWDEAPDVQRVDRLKLGQTTLMCDQLSVYNTAQLSWNQSQISNHQLRRDAAWEITGAGHVVAESVNQQGAFSVTANRVQYVALHSMLRIEGAPREAAVIRRTTLNDPPGREPQRWEISTGAVNLKTGEMDLQVSSVVIQNLNEVLNTPSAPSSPGQGNLGFPNQPAKVPSTTPLIPSARDSYPLRRP